MAANHLIVFDLDDTLLDTSQLFFDIRERVVNYLMAAGFDRELIVATHAEIEIRNISRYGYVSERTMVSLRETMEALFSVLHKPFRRESLEAVSLMAAPCLFEVPALLPDVRPLLEWCRESYRLAVLTRGSISLQNVKLASSGLSGFFEHVEVVPSKGEEAFCKVLEILDCSPSRAVSVGDSARFDILPAVAIGMKAIQVKYPKPWIRWNHDKGFPEQTIAPVARRLAEVRQILELSTASDEGRAG